MKINWVEIDPTCIYKLRGTGLPPLSDITRVDFPHSCLVDSVGQLDVEQTYSF